MLKINGAERLAFGTDSILNTAKQFRKMREEFRKDNIGDHDLDMIFGGSAAEILGLNKDLGSPSARKEETKERKEVSQC